MKSLRLLFTSSRRRGTVLVLVLWVCLSLVSLALYFADSMRVEYRAAQNAVGGLQADQAIEGARRYVSYVLNNLTTAGEAPDTAEYESEAVEVGNAKFWLIGRVSETETTTESDAPSFALIDEGTKINLNNATVDMLAALPGMTSPIAAAIVDWRDADSEISDGGAESSDYLLGDPAYMCKDSRFETPEELRLVRDVDLTLLYGEDTNRNGILDPNEDDGDASPPADDADGILDAGLLEYITVFSREPNTRSDGSARINVRTSTQEFYSYLETTLGAGRTSQIRQTLGQDLSSIRSLLELYVQSGMNATEFAQVENALTVSSGSYVEGRVNASTAPVQVLACIPGLGQTGASQLIKARAGKTADELKSLAWVAAAIDPNVAAEAGPYLTTHSYQFSADVVAVGEEGRGFQRELLVFDTTGDEPSVVYRRDLSRCGWPLGVEIRRELESGEQE